MKPLVLFLLLVVNSDVYAVYLPPDGGGAVDLAHDHTPEVVQMNRWLRYQQDLADLTEQGGWQKQAGNSPTFELPLSFTGSEAGYYGISNYVDQNMAFPDMLQDYACGERTYDLSSGYNHSGIDYFSWPFAWHKMDQNQVQVVAAASGVITTKIDGNSDRTCDFNDPSITEWNAVYVTHADGSYSWYGHLKSGSLTSKPVGAAVAQGEYLGVVGSSGFSTGPHLHFETYDGADALIEPYAGSCNALNANSWWASQPDYYESTINQISTHDAVPEFAECPSTQDVTHAENHFMPGESVYFVTYYRDQLANQVTSFLITNPSGQTFQSWTHSSTQAHYAASWWYWIYTLPSSAPAGRWTFTTNYQGVENVHHFWVGDLIFATGFE